MMAFRNLVLPWLLLPLLVSCSGGDNKASKSSVSGPAVTVSCRQTIADGSPGAVTVTTVTTVDCSDPTTTTTTTTPGVTP